MVHLYIVVTLLHRFCVDPYLHVHLNDRNHHQFNQCFRLWLVFLNALMFNQITLILLLIVFGNIFSYVFMNSYSFIILSKFFCHTPPDFIKLDQIFNFYFMRFSNSFAFYTIFINFHHFHKKMIHFASKLGGYLTLLSNFTVIR